MKNATLNKINTYFGNRYADLASIHDAVIPPLADQGIALVQIIETRDVGTVVVTKLIKGAEEIISECPVIANNRCKPQEFGFALTYACRYSMAAIVGISVDDDDDANAAQSMVVSHPSQPFSERRERPKEAPSKPPLRQQVNIIDVPCDDHGPDWTAFAIALIAEIDKSPNIAMLNALIKSHNQLIAEVKAKAPKVYEHLEAATTKCRATLGQAPLQPKNKENKISETQPISERK